MAFKAGFLLCLLSFSVVKAQSDYGVTYTSTQICAVKGSTVKLHCSYRYPHRGHGRDTVVEQAVWFIKMKGDEPVDLQTEAEFAGRVQHRCDKTRCTLTISDLRESDSAQYQFRFITNQPGGRYTGSPGVSLSVSVLRVEVRVPQPVWYPSWAEVTCHSSCGLHHSYIWSQNGLNIHKETSSIQQYFDGADSVSCAVKGYEKFPSPSVCVLDQTCNRVTYTSRSICAIKGSSVDISCTYSHRNYVVSKFWFSPERHRQWRHTSQPEDIMKDSQFLHRVQVLETAAGTSTLRISDLRDTDSAQYRFKFTTLWFEWGSSLPGTTLTVTALQVQVTRVITVHQSSTEAELTCLSSCSPAGRLSYVWFKNGQKVLEETSSFTDNFDPSDVISCAFRGHEDHRSPAVYAPKLPSVTVSPSGPIVEDSSVTLTCSSGANPAARRTLYKGNQTVPLGSAGSYQFTSISSEDRGTYYCRSEDQHSVSLFLDVQYAPKLPSVSVSPSGQIVEDSSVTLTCSSDANPAASYTWYKENEGSPKGSGQMFTISNIRPEHSGNYYCAAQNTRGRHNSTVHLTVVTASWKFPVALLVTVILLVLILTALLLWIRRQRSLKRPSDAEERPDNRAQQVDDLQYTTVGFSTAQSDLTYCNFSPAQLHRYEEDCVVYTTPTFSRTRGTRREAAGPDAAALYAKVHKNHRV